METGGRMTRSRAKALGATPMAAVEPKTASKTASKTGRRGKAASQASEQLEQKPAEQKALDFCDAAEDIPANQDEEACAKNESDTALHVANIPQLPATTPTKAAIQPGDEVLMASPIVMRTDQSSEAAAPDHVSTPQPLDIGGASTDNNEAPQQFPLFPVAQQTPMLTPSPLAPSASPQPAAASPFDLVFDQEAPAASPAPAGNQASPLPIAASPLGVGLAEDAVAASPAPGVSPLPAATPLSFTSDVPHGAYEQPAPSPITASIPATPLATGQEQDELDAMEAAMEAADFSPLPDDDEMAGSPISLSGGPALTPAPQEHLQHAADSDQMVEDAPMADATPLTFVSDVRGTPMAEQSPMAGFFGLAPGSVPHSAAAANASRPSNAMSFQGFAAMCPTPGDGAEPVVESPSLEGLAARHADNKATPEPAACVAATPLQGDGLRAAAAPAATPAEESSVPPAPASTPEIGPLPTWTLEQTPLNRGIAGAAQEQVQEATMEYTGVGAEDEDMMEQDVPTAVETAKTPVATPPSAKPNAGRSPLPASAIRAKTPVAKPTTASKPTPMAKTTTPAAAGTTKSSPYFYVESRYNKTPNTATAASKSAVGQPVTASKATPAAPINAAGGAKSIKRVSIHTPEGPRSSAPQRQVVPTPYRPKSAQSTAEAEEPAAMQPIPSGAPELLQGGVISEASISADQRPAQAAERLQTIHNTEQLRASKDSQPSAPTSVPSYLQPTQAFAVKTAKPVKSKVDAGTYDPRSLRQLKREIKEVAAKKAAKEIGMAEVRSSKLTPNVKEAQLPMPDDDEVSDDEVEYNAAQENELVEAMGGLEVAPPKDGAPLPLRGLPAPKGRHLRFNDKGAAEESPQRVVLRGLPVATGKYKRFE